MSEGWAQAIFAAVIAIGGGIIGIWNTLIMNRIAKAEENHEETARALNSHMVSTAQTYATKSDVERGFDKISEKLERIFDKLDGKADK